MLLMCAIRRSTMLKKVKAIVVSAGLLASFAAVQGFSQTPDGSKMGKMSGSKMSGSKMSHDEMMAKMDKMTADDKANMMDHMSMKEKSSAMKMGHDMSKMSSQEKADMFDKMTMEKKMAMMHGSTMKNGKMDHMRKDNMGKMDKKY